MGALIMLGWLGGLLVLVYALVLRLDPEVRRPSRGEPAEGPGGGAPPERERTG